jgi:hypothetical protein
LYVDGMNFRRIGRTLGISYQTVSEGSVQNQGYTKSFT